MDGVMNKTRFAMKRYKDEKNREETNSNKQKVCLKRMG